MIRADTLLGFIEDVIIILELCWKSEFRLVKCTMRAMKMACPKIVADNQHSKDTFFHWQKLFRGIHLFFYIKWEKLDNYSRMKLTNGLGLKKRKKKLKKKNSLFQKVLILSLCFRVSFRRFSFSNDIIQCIQILFF